jgi:hypothetical protein
MMKFWLAAKRHDAIQITLSRDRNCGQPKLELFLREIPILNGIMVSVIAQQDGCIYGSCAAPKWKPLFHECLPAGKPLLCSLDRPFALRAQRMMIVRWHGLTTILNRANSLRKQTR